MQPIQQDLVIQQGATFQQSLQWCNGTPTFMAITNVQIGLPTLITVPNHGLTQPTPVWITNVKGAWSLNTKNYRDTAPRYASVIDVNTLAIDWDTGDDPPYQSGGVLTFYAPMNLTGYTARLQIRPAPGPIFPSWPPGQCNPGEIPPPYIELNTSNGGIAITAGTGTINLLITAAQTQSFTWANAVYDLQLTAADGVTVTKLAEGSVSVIPAVTQPVSPSPTPTPAPSP